MADYSVAEVEAITGIKAHTLRVWERRYNFIRPSRTETNIRYYTDYELRLLVSVSLLIRSGFKISKIDKMSYDEINQEVTKVINSRDVQDTEEISSLTLCMMNLDENTFNHIFQRMLIRKGLLKTITEVIYPFLTNAGFLWSSNQISPIHEHFITNLIRQKIIAATDTLPVARIHSPEIVMFLPTGENHEIGLLIANFIARNLGWKVYYLGQNVPVDDLKDLNTLTRAKFILTIIITPLSEEFTDKIIKLSEKIDASVLVSGNPENFGAIKNNENIRLLPTPDDLIKILENEYQINT